MKNSIKNQEKFQNLLRRNLADPEAQFRIEDTPLYPLAFHVPMPESIDFDNGQVSFGFSNFRLNGLDSVELVRAEIDSINLRFPELQLTGNYDLQAKHMPKAEFDYAGNLMPLDGSNAGAAGSDAASPTYKPADQDEVNGWVGSARDQKPKVSETLHGPNLLTSYHDHNDSLNDVFILAKGLRKVWTENNITAQMSRDTHEAVKNNTVINDKKYVLDPSAPNFKSEYNALALARQAAVSAGCHWAAENKLHKGSPRYEAMLKAGAAALQFGQTLKNNLGGDGDIEQMKPDAETGEHKGVYQALNNPHYQPAPSVSIEQFRNFIAQGYSQDGGKAATLEASEKGWPVLDEGQRAQIRKFMHDFYIEDALAREDIPQTLWSGVCLADLSRTEASLQLKYDDDGAWSVQSVEIRLPAFAFELDDSEWTGEAAGIIREGLMNIHFVKSLLQKKLETGIARILSNVASNTLDR